jgi:hypothetical protein
LRNFSAFSSALLLLNAMGDFAGPDACAQKAARLCDTSAQQEG